MAYSIGLTAGVVYDEDTDIYQMTSGLANELGKVVFDIDPVTSYSFNYSTQINANPTGDYAGSNGYFEVRLGDTENGLTFFVDHSEYGADLYVHHNSNLLCNLEIPNFKFNVPQTMEINCVENTFIMTYDDVFLGDVHCDSNILFNDGWLEFTACNVIGTTAILDSYNYEPNFTVTHTARFMNGISADDWDGIMLEHIGDCWWSNVDPENSSNMHTMGSIGIGTTDPIYNLHVEGTIYASSYCNIALCEEDLKVQVPVGSIMTLLGNEYINDPTFHKIIGQTVNRADYIELANSLGIPKSQPTFRVVNKSGWNYQGDYIQVGDDIVPSYYESGGYLERAIPIVTATNTPLLDGVSLWLHANNTRSNGLAWTIGGETSFGIQSILSPDGDRTAFIENLYPNTNETWERMTIKRWTGNVGIGISAPAAKLHVVGAILATADVTAYYSDLRLKKDVREITSALDKLSKIRGVHYTQNELAETYGFHNYEPQVGVIAQELKEVLPEAVKLAPFDTNAEQGSISGENYLTVQYHKIVPLLIQAIKEQQKEINDLRQMVLMK